jgi:hypothetical protein
MATFGVKHIMSGYPNQWDQITGLKRGRASEDYRVNRRHALTKTLDKISRGILRIEKTRRETGKKCFEEKRLQQLRKNFLLFAQEYYALGGTPKDLRPY